MGKGILGMSYLKDGRRVDLEPGGKKIFVSFGGTRNQIDVNSGAVAFVYPGPYGATIACEIRGETVFRDIFNGRVIDQEYFAEIEQDERETIN